MHSDNLRNRFTGIALERSQFADELAEHVRRLGGDPPVAGHQSGILHRGWRELETSIRPKGDYEFLVECEAGEENTLRHYEHALTRELPTQVRPVVDRQRLAVQQALLELREVEQLRRAS